MTIDEAIGNVKESLNEAAGGFKQMQVMLIVFSALITVAIILLTIHTLKDK